MVIVACPKLKKHCTQARHIMSSMRRELSSLECNVSHSTRAALYTHARQNRLLFAKRQRGINRQQTACGVCKHAVDFWYFLVPFCKDLARMYCTPQPNQNICRRWDRISQSRASTLNHWTIPISSDWTIWPKTSLKLMLNCSENIFQLVFYYKISPSTKKN